jgi:WD40 repeat protein
MIVTGSWDNTARVWNAATGQQIIVFSGHRNGLNAVTFSPDGSRAASASWDRTARVFDVRSGTELFALSGHNDAVYGIAFSPDGSLLATVSWDMTLRLWEADHGTQLAALTGHGDGLNGVTFTSDGQLIATASNDHTIRLWEIGSLNPLGKLEFRKQICSERLRGAQTITDGDAQDPILTPFKGNNPCLYYGPLSARYWLQVVRSP